MYFKIIYLTKLRNVCAVSLTTRAMTRLPVIEELFWRRPNVETLTTRGRWVQTGVKVRLVLMASARIRFGLRLGLVLRLQLQLAIRFGLGLALVLRIGLGIFYGVCYGYD